MSRGHPDFIAPFNQALYSDYWHDFYATWNGLVPAESYVDVTIGVVPAKSVIAITFCLPSCKDNTTPSKFECYVDTERFRSAFFFGETRAEPIHYPLFDEGKAVSFRIYNYSAADQEYTWTGLGYFIEKHRSSTLKIPNCAILGNPEDYDVIWIGESSLWEKQICFAKAQRIKTLDERIRERVEELKRR